jgi:hypothetical protein
LVKEGGRYELFHVRGFIYYGKLIKTVQDFKVKFFDSYSIAFEKYCFW